MQEELDTTPLLLTDEAFSSMHKATCQNCGAAAAPDGNTSSLASSLILTVMKTWLLGRIVVSWWVTVQDLTRAISQFRDDVLSIHESKNPLLLSMDIRSSPAEQDAALICFYKKPNIELGRPLKCRFEANTDVTRLFDGEPGHLVPSASHFLVESDMFIMAGRMVGHSFVHGGPCLSGLSPAQSCLEELEGESELSDEGKRSVRDLAFAWDLPCLTGNNRRWLFEKMLIHAVIGRVTRQIKQLRRGLKETPMWAMLSQCPDTVALLFPQEGAVDYSPAVILQRITWPRDDDEDDDCSVDTKCRVSGYLRRFIENASPDVMTNLVKFWTGWEILPRNNLSIEVVNGRFPTASTCYETLRIPGHYKDYASFENDMLACIGTCQTGFGLVVRADHGVENVDVAIGQPRMVISPEYIHSLLELNLSIPCIAALLGVSRRTVHRRMAESDFSVREMYSTLTDVELDQCVRDIKSRQPHSGYRMMKALLQAQGLRVQYDRVRASLHVLTPSDYNIVIFGGIDGFSRKDRETMERHVDSCYSHLMLYTTSKKGFLNIGNATLLFCCHYVILPRLQDDLDTFRSGWANHPKRTEGHVTPNQLWELGRIHHPIPVSDNMEGVDIPQIEWENRGFAPDGHSSVIVPDTESPLTDGQMAALREAVDPRAASQSFGSDIYIAAVQFMSMFYLMTEKESLGVFLQCIQMWHKHPLRHCFLVILQMYYVFMADNCSAFGIFKLYRKNNNKLTFEE
ncbi:hypothetical protein F7725_001553 [Dissostichus mawsoni]|uniref:Uncharacterized protein n=1 Tax=Dissostichus mawsoni TaxID=36200 RepID=A0A7J5XZZ1_DISMA|nr:hypothetical protein F7725_001553 [Dissostichus mawsoni]